MASQLRSNGKSNITCLINDGLMFDPIPLAISKKKSDDTLVLTIGNEEIEESNEEKLLGFTINKNLKWESHINNLVRKLNFRLFTLRRLNDKLPKFLLKRVCDAIFISHIRYGLPLYCPVQIKEDDPVPGCISALKVVFNDCLRLLTCNKRRDHASIAGMLEDVGWLSVNQLAVETRLIKAWKFFT